MTHSTKCAPAGAGTPSGANEPTQQSIEEKSVMSTIDATSDKVTCTGDVWCGCTCHSCTVTFEHCDTEPLTVPTLLVEADQQLDDGLAEIITARMGALGNSPRVVTPSDASVLNYRTTGETCDPRGYGRPGGSYSRFISA